MRSGQNRPTFAVVVERIFPALPPLGAHERAIFGRVFTETRRRIPSHVRDGKGPR